MTKKVVFLISVGILFMASGCSKTQVSADSAPSASESVSYAEPVEKSDAVASVRVKRTMASSGIYAFEVVNYVGRKSATNIVACLPTRSDCKMLRVGELYYEGAVLDDDPATYPKQISDKVRAAGTIRLYCRGGSTVYFVVDAAATAHAERTATTGIKVVSVKWRGPTAGSWLPIFIVRNDGPAVNMAKIEYQVFDGEVLVGSSSLYFNSGIPSNTTAKQEGIPFDSEGQPKIKVVDIWVQ
jgi:hypothetical protein